MNIKLSGALFVTLCVAASGQGASAQGQQAQTNATPAVQSSPANASTPAATGANNSNNVKGNFEFDALGFKGSLHFDGNPLSILQQPAQTAQPASGGVMPMQPQMVAPGQGMPMQQMPAGQIPMQPMQQMQQPMMMPIGQMPMQQVPMQMPMQQQVPMQQMPMQQSMMMPMQGSPMQVMQTAPQAAQQPAAAAPMIDLSGVEKAARALAPTVMKALPAMGLPAAPAFIDQSSKVIQQLFPAQKQPAMPTAAMNPMNSMMPMQQMNSGAPMTMPMASAPASASVDVLNALDQFQRAVKYNLEMAQEAAYLAGFGDPAMRATSALEAQKNANEARETAERAGTLAGNYGGEAAQLLANIRAGAANTQAFADQARVSSNNSNGLSP